MPDYIPDAGDLIWLTFDPQTGREQAGRRPGLVLTPRAYNQKAGLAIVCPVTSQVKGYPFEVSLPSDCGVAGVVLVDHVKSLDWKSRRAKRIGSIPEAVHNEVLSRLAPLLGC